MPPFDRSNVALLSCIKARYWSKIAFCHTTPAVDAPAIEFHVRILPQRLVRKNEKVGLPDTKKFANIFTRFDTVHERDRRTDIARWHWLRYA